MPIRISGHYNVGIEDPGSGIPIGFKVPVNVAVSLFLGILLPDAVLLFNEKS
jgi:hypothetical protein